MAKRPELVVIEGLLAGKRFQVTEGVLRLGRSSSNDIQIPDEELSRNHCIFEPVGEMGARITDLASANGTYVNGELIKKEPVELKEGDIITLGNSKIRFGEENKIPVGVDLGLGDKKVTAEPVKKRSPMVNLLWVVVVILVGVLIYLVLMTPRTEETQPAPIAAEEQQMVKEFFYEKVDGDAKHIFRYEMTLSPDKVLSVKIDDVPEENRHLVKSTPLSENAMKELNEILSFETLKEIDREYVGPEPDKTALESWYLKVVYSSRARTVKIINTPEPDAFRNIREKLEAFSKSELGVWAIQYSRDKLIELAENAIELGRAKWEDRDVNYGNLMASAAAYKEAMFYLETVNPKPDNFGVAREGLRRSTEELDKRYTDQRFLADRAINLAQWELAKRELQTLMEMVPDRNDDRYRDASAKLITVENHLKNGGK